MPGSEQGASRPLFTRSELLRLIIPLVIEQLLLMTVGMADTVMVTTSGEAAVSGVSLVDNINTLIIQIFSALSTGGAVVVAQYLGRREAGNAKLASKQLLYTMTAVSVFLMAAALLFRQHILSLIFGHVEADVMESALVYFLITAAAYPFMGVYNAGSALFRAMGNSSVSMFCSLVVNVINIAVNAIFIYGFGMGAAGAAIATTIGNVMASAYYLWYFLRRSRSMSLSPRDFTCRDGLLRGVCATGLPTAIFSALMSVSTIVLNQILVSYGNAPVAAIGIVFKANMFITFLQMGLANGVQPLLGYSYGAGITDRFREVESFTKKCCVAVGVAATALFFVAREPIIRLFISDDAVVRYGVEMLVAYMVSGPFIGLLFVNMNCMQSVEHALPATVLSVMRQGVLLIPLLYLLEAVAGLDGVIYGQAITDYIAVLLSIIIWRNIRKSL